MEVSHVHVAESHIELLELLSGAENDVRSGKVAPISETFSDLRTILLEGKFIQNLEMKFQG
jgi:hypothetical protein